MGAFPKYVNGVLEATFCKSGQNWPSFVLGPCWEQYEDKITNTNKCQLQHLARNFWFFML